MNLHNIKKRLIAELIEREGGYVNDPTDRGGATKYGITAVVAIQNEYYGVMKDLPYELAEKIYLEKYWDSLWLDKVYWKSQLLAETMFDFGVNSGTSRACKYLQRVLNNFNYNERYGLDLVEDGIMGVKTLDMLEQYLHHRHTGGLRVLLDTYNGLRIAFLVNIGENDKEQRRFSYGWLNRVSELLG